MHGRFSQTTIALSAAAFTLLMMASCSDPVVVPEARNSLTGTVDGTAFTATNVQAIKDTNDVFSITGRILDDVRFQIYYMDESVEAHPVQTEGGFLEFIDVLDSLFNVQPPIEDSLILDSLATGLLDLLTSDEEPLAPDRSFGFYIIGDFIYYSEYGILNITEFDQELNRISGTLDIRLLNFFGGRKDWNAILEDIQVLE